MWLTRDVSLWGNMTLYGDVRAGYRYYVAVEGYPYENPDYVLHVKYLNGWGMPEITSPASGTTLSGSTVTFYWTFNALSVDASVLYVGTSPGASDIYLSDWLTTNTHVTVSGLPTDGSTVYVRLVYHPPPTPLPWPYVDAQYTAYNGSGGCPPFVPGPDACSTTGCPCDEGQGDCDFDSDCAQGLICAQDVGAKYGWTPSRDVCEQPGGGGCPAFVPSPDACSTAGCPCDEGQGDCDFDSDCAQGLICAQDVGAKYGWTPSRDVCEQPGGGGCPAFVPGPDACSTAGCPCDEGQGDCDFDSDCAQGLICAQDVGAKYGWTPSRDVCEQPGGGGCPAFVPGPDACSTAGCPCDEGQGDCDFDSDCAQGLICAQDVGAKYGWTPSRDVCEQPGGSSNCILASKFGTGAAKSFRISLYRSDLHHH